MDRTNRAVTDRRSRENARSIQNVYVDGNAVRRLQEIPDRRYSSGRPAQNKKRKSSRSAASAKASGRAREVSRTTQRNRRKAMSMGRGYVVFLTVVSVAVLFFCVYYLQLRADVTGRIKTVAALETELSELREENDAYESQVNSDVDLNRIKKIAIGRLGMNYPRDDQKKTYRMSNNSYVRQYQDIPRSK